MFEKYCNQLGLCKKRIIFFYIKPTFMCPHILLLMDVWDMQELQSIRRIISLDDKSVIYFKYKKIWKWKNV